MSLAHHLHEAIAVNRERRAYYAAQTGGASRGLSNVLIATEYAALPLGWLIDRWAQPYNQKGIPIIQHDFVSMKRVPSADTAPRYQSAMAPEVYHNVRRVLTSTRKTARRQLFAADLRAFASTCRHVLTLLDEIERTHHSHLAMTKHLVESAGYNAEHGINYAEKSDGDTMRLTQNVALAHLLLLRLGLVIDRHASRFHTQGVGIIVNDVPPIPFRGNA